MRIGLLADIHENVELLRSAVEACREQGAERFLVLGDICKDGKRLDETVQVLIENRARGVWGNHDFALCVEPDAALVSRYLPATGAFMASLTPRMEVAGYVLQHILPQFDPRSLEDLWCYRREDLPDTRGGARACLRVGDWRVCIIGHYHRWMAATDGVPHPWDGRRELRFGSQARWVVVTGAVEDGYTAILDTRAHTLQPLTLYVT